MDANLAWFRSYLTNRKKYICINNATKTNEQKVTWRVPQGSIPGPLLFLIHLNDVTSMSFVNHDYRNYWQIFTAVYVTVNCHCI